MRPGATPGLHTHDFPELFWIEAGRARHLFGDGEELLGPGTLVAVAPQDRHGFACADATGYSIFNVAFPMSQWRRLRHRYADTLFDPWGRAGPLPARTHRLRQPQRLALHGFAKELREGPRHAAALDRFLLNVCHLLGQAEDAGPAGAPAWLLRAVSRLKRDEDALTEGTRAFVRLCHRSPEHVSRESRRWLGQTPTALVNGLRLDLAASRIAAGDAAIVSVAQDCGFSNVSHFYRLFQARFGATPAAHRRAAEAVLRPSSTR